METTIAAIATPLGEGSIGVVRISGKDAIAVSDKVFKAASGKKLSEIGGYQALFGDVFYEEKKIDEAVALVFKAPKSYTGEDVVELSVHGGTFVLKSVLRAVLNSGAVMAEKGEFTRRAFENGKLDLSQAESVMDIISADGEQALRASLAIKDGALTKKCSEIKDKLTLAAARVAAFSDYPDEEPEFSGIDMLPQILAEIELQLNNLLENYDIGKMVKNGIKTVIVGPPNAGKSTLMNLISGYERSIVTNIAGTTRDFVEETVSMGGISLKLFDTAGLRETDDLIEKIGVSKTKELINSADLIIAVVDGADDNLVETNELLKMLKGHLSIVVYNKSDIADADCSFAEQNGLKYVKMSAKNSEGVDRLIEAVKEVTKTEHLSGDNEVYLNERQRDCCGRAYFCVNEAKNALALGITVDAVGVCLDDALAALMEMTGERVTVEVANKVFEHFCVGK